MAGTEINLNWTANSTSPLYDQDHQDGQRGGAAGGLATLSTITDNYIGAFKVPDGAYGTGTIAINPLTGTMFVDDTKVNNMPVFEVSIPALVIEETDLSLLNSATILQSPESLQTRIPSQEWGTYGTGNQASIWSMFHDGEYLYINAAVGYDASESVTDTTIRVNDPTDLATSTVEGCFKIEDSVAAARWISPVPTEHQSFIGADHLIGAGNGVSIVGRLSKGPSMFGFDAGLLKTAVTGASLANIEHMNFKAKWMVDDYMNYGGASGGVNNDMYVTTSIPAYGFIIPGTRTYCVLGYSEGWDPTPLAYNQADPDIDGYVPDDPGAACSNPYVGTHTDGGRANGAIAYKNNTGTWTNNVDAIQGGYFGWEVENRGPFYWMFDLNTIESASAVDEILPYEYGPFPAPFSPAVTTKEEGKSAALGSGTYDPTTDILYLSLPYAQNTDRLYAGPPVVIAYDLSGVA